MNGTFPASIGHINGLFPSIWEYFKTFEDESETENMTENMEKTAPATPANSEKNQGSKTPGLPATPENFRATVGQPCVIHNLVDPSADPPHGARGTITDASQSHVVARIQVPMSAAPSVAIDCQEIHPPAIAYESIQYVLPLHPPIQYVLPLHPIGSYIPSPMHGALGEIYAVRLCYQLP